MKKGLFNRRIPTVFALLVLVIAIAVSVVLLQSGIFYVGKAAPDGVPRNFLITNISDTSFTVVFQTTALSESVVTINDSETGNSVILDDRDKKTGAKNKYYSHHITAQDLKPETRYSFKIISSGKEYISPDYSVNTGITITSPPPAQKPLFGKALLPDGSVASDSVVTAKTDSSSLVSAITDNKGEFILPSNSLRNSANTEYQILNDQTPFTISVFHQDLRADVTTTFLTAQNLPAVVLSQKYSFLEEQEAKEVEENQFNFTPNISGGQTVSIVVPEEGEFFVDSRPRFSGTSYPNSSVSIIIDKTPGIQVISGADGSWIYQPQNDLPQGDRRISISANSPGGDEESDTKTFTIFPSGSQITESATPSATPTQRPSPTLSPTPTPSPTQIPSPTIDQASPSPTPTAIPTIAATPTLSPTPLPTIPVTPTPIPSIAQPGSFENTFVLTGVSAVLIIAGLILLFAL